VLVLAIRMTRGTGDVAFSRPAVLKATNRRTGKVTEHEVTGPADKVALAPAVYLLELSSGTFRSGEETVTVKAGESLEVTLVLKAG
jgi:hypothetical protein